MTRFDGIGLLMIIGAAGYILTLAKNRHYRRVLRNIARECDRCLWYERGYIYGPGMGTLIPCPVCADARRALGEVIDAEENESGAASGASY